MQNLKNLYPTNKFGHTMLLLLLIIAASCNSSKELEALVGKKLSTPQGHLFTGKELTIYRDSTFEYKEGGPAIKFTKGRWRIDGKKSIIYLTSNYATANRQNISPDTVIISIENVPVRLINKHKVRMNGEIFKTGL